MDAPGRRNDNAASGWSVADVQPGASHRRAGADRPWLHRPVEVHQAHLTPHAINIPPQSGGYFRFGHSPNTTGNAQVRFLLACQPRIGLLATRKRVSGIVKTYLITFSIHL